MNFLGHLFLSGDRPLITVGNFMADAVKGRDLSRFPEEVAKGIRLHRAIDSFTDVHPLFVTGRRRARIHAGRYAGVVMDLFYDHLLASRWESWHPEKLADYAQRMYTLLHTHREILPERTRLMLPHMVHGDWLTAYSTMDGLAGALAGLSRRAREGAGMLGAERILAENLDAYAIEFEQFLPEVRKHINAYL
jgi:acyl carrier protein phosphodiesterase